LLPLASARALRIGIFSMALFLGLVVVFVLLKPYAEGFFETTLSGLRKLAIVPGLPVLAILLSEIPIRDGIRQRTLLYPLLGPVPRTTLCWVRTMATAVILALGASFTVVLIRLIQGESLGPLAREFLAIWLGAGAFTALFGALHLSIRRGLIGGLAYYFLLDFPLAYLPFSLRNLSLSHHMRVIADLQIQMELPIAISPPSSSVLVSSIVLVVVAVGLGAVGALLFSRKDLGNLC
jgi:hypothetical protein